LEIQSGTNKRITWGAAAEGEGKETKRRLTGGGIRCIVSFFTLTVGERKDTTTNNYGKEEKKIAKTSKPK